MHRRTFLQGSLLASLTSALQADDRPGPRRIVLRSSWQTVNIGDVAHTPGVLALLEKYLPEIEVRLWPSNVGNGVDQMLLKRFPKLKIVKSREEIDAAFTECDFLLHGSGPSLVAQKDVARWRSETGKPFGVFGITLGGAADPTNKSSGSSGVSDSTRELLSAARFIFFRDSMSLATIKKAGVTCPIMEFGPDGAFAVDLRNDEAAKKFLDSHGLETGKFFCVIPRLRYTPYWKVHATRPFDEKKHARNEEMKEHDHAPLREAIVALARQTPMKVLVCPEDATQMEVGKELLIDKLPDDVRANVVWQDRFWMTDEAVSTYVRSAGLFGNEMHSPIMCIGNGIPAIVCRWAEQTSKGIMWRDIGLGDWLFDHDQDEPAKSLTAAVLAIAQDPAAAQAKVFKARQLVRDRQKEMTAVLAATK
jgi:polysaccharide pyruvyl transferase WcaK-like protein